MEPITLYPSRKKWGAIFALGAAFFAMGVNMIVDGKEPLEAWLCTIFFGIMALASIAALFPGAGWLRLSLDSMQWRVMFRTSKPIAWAEVGEIGTYRIHHNDAVGFNLPAQSSGVSRLNAQLVGFGASLPDTFGMKAAELAALMQRYREAADQRRK